MPLFAKKVCTILASVELGFNDFGAEGVREICSMLLFNRSLSALGLAGNGLGAVYAPSVFLSMSRALKRNKTLTSIDLASNDMSGKDEAGLELLIRALAQSTSLTDVEMCWSGVNGAAVGRFTTSTM